MSNDKRRAHGTAPLSRRDNARSVTTLHGPGDVVAMIPYLMGFTPSDSLVMVALEGPRRRFGPCLRLDLADSSEGAEAQAQYLVGVAVQHRFDPVIMVAFSVDADRAATVIQALRQALANRHIRVMEALRADGERWWSYTCDDGSCCSPEGSAYDVDSSRVAAEAVLAGLPKAPDRESLRAEFTPANLDVRNEVALECERQRLEGTPPPSVEQLDELLTRHLEAPGEMPVEDTVTLLLTIQQVARRDAAWTLMTRENADGHFQLWRHVMRNAPDVLMAPAGALTAFAAWLDGRGAHAWLALERVEQVQPGYSMCRLLRQILDEAVDPEVWSTFPLRRGMAG